MIAAIDGTIFQKERNPIIVMSSGVGYAVHITENAYSSLKTGDNIILYIHTHLRDDAIELFGFTKNNDLYMFELLLSVSGIGPRTALLICNRGVTEVEKAIQEADVDFFTSIPRLGKKNAQKIIIELKNKLGSNKDIDLKYESSGETKQLIEALTSMGFDKKEIFATIKLLNTNDITLEQKIVHALKILGKPKI